MNPSKKTPQDSRPTLREWMANALDVPTDLLDGGIRLELWGRQGLAVHGCTRIEAFTPTEVKLELGRETLVVCGQRLICTTFLGGDVGVEGHICGLYFEDREGR